jgi:hypothetical protein
VGPGAGLNRCGKSRSIGIRSPDLPARSKSLYRLRYPGSHVPNLPALKCEEDKNIRTWSRIKRMALRGNIGGSLLCTCKACWRLKRSLGCVTKSKMSSLQYEILYR